MELTADQAKQGAGKKRKLKRRERNHAKREQKAVEIHSSDPSVPLSPAKLHSGLERPATAASDLSDDDLAIVVADLGFVPTNLVRVAAWDHGTRKPVATILYPLTKPAAERRRKGGGRDFEPFPTIVWLTCPILKVRVHPLCSVPLRADPTPSQS